jgi:penicillin-binding protein 1A
MGIRTPVSSNYAMTLGGLREGVTPLDLAHAYLTFASGGELVYGSLSPDAGRYKGGIRNLPGPPGIQRIRRRGTGEDARKPIRLPDGSRADNRPRKRRVLKQSVAEQIRAILATVVKSGTGTRAALGPGRFAAGKTGTTENYSDAWFVGFNERYTVAVWVGYPEGFKPMKTEWRGEPVAGGTYPAAIWKSFMQAAADLYPAKGKKSTGGEDSDGSVAEPPPTDATEPGATAAPTAPEATEPAPAPVAPEPEPQQPAPAPEPEPAAPAPAPAVPDPVTPAAPPGGAAAPPG